MFGYVLRNNPSEIYRINIFENVITFTVRDTLVEDILKKVTRKEMLDGFAAIESVKEEGVVYFSIKLPFITFPNYAHKGIDWKTLGVCAEKISLLLYLFNMYLDDRIHEELFCLSNNPQLMIIATGYSKTREIHACPMELGFSEDIAQRLAKKYQKGASIDEAVHTATLVYLKLSSITKRDFEKDKKRFESMDGGMFDVVVKVRDSGVPQFSVPGSCACLGENPDTFKYSRYMHSHNLDSTLQQMTMLVAVIIFWDKVLRPLSKK